MLSRWFTDAHCNHSVTHFIEPAVWCSHHKGRHVLYLTKLSLSKAQVCTNLPPLYRMSSQLVIQRLVILRRKSICTYRRLWLISTCAYSSKWKGNMHLIKNMHQYSLLENTALTRYMESMFVLLRDSQVCVECHNWYNFMVNYLLVSVA